MWRWSAICTRCWSSFCRRVSGARRRQVARAIEDSKGAVAVRDIKNLPDSGHLYAAHVMHDLWRITGGDAIVVTDVGQHQMWEAQYFNHETSALAHHFGRPGHDGLCSARRDRRQDRMPRQGSLGDRRRRRFPDDRRGALHHRAGESQDQHRGHQQRLSRHGAPVAGVLLRAATTRPRRWSAPTSSSWPMRTASPDGPSERAPRWMPQSPKRAITTVRSCSTSWSRRKTRCTR